MMIDGMDVQAVYEAARRAVAYARAGKGPSFIICNTWRFGGHHVGDKQEYKDDEESKAWRLRDPLLTSAKALAAAGVASTKAIAQMEQDAIRQMAAVADAVRTGSEPAAQTLLEHVYG